MGASSIMKNAYSVIDDLNIDAIKMLKENNISVVIRNSEKTPNSNEVMSLLQKYDILIIGVQTKIKKEILKSITSPKIIATLSIGTDHIDEEVKKSKLITVLNINMANTISVAEHIFSLILSLNKRITEANNLVLEKKGHKKNIQVRAEDISGKKLGLIGAGNISKEVIKIAKVFHMQISCFTKNPTSHQDLINLGVSFVSLDEILKKSDIINVSIPLTEETRNLISKEKIKLIQSTATFINTSRVDIVDTKALIKKAEEHNTFYVGLDIDLENYEELFSKFRKNVIVTPHIAGVSKQAIERMDVELVSKIVEKC